MCAVCVRATDGGRHLMWPRDDKVDSEFLEGCLCSWDTQCLELWLGVLGQVSSETMSISLGEEALKK